MIFFRHFVEIITWSTVIGQNSWNRYTFLKWFLLVILRICSGILFHSMNMYPSYILSFYIDFLPCSDNQIRKLFTKLFSILLDTYFCLYTTNYVSWNNNSVYYDTRFVQLWGWEMIVFKKIHDVACFEQLINTGKGKLIDQIESNSQMRSTFFEYMYKVIIVHYIKYLIWQLHVVWYHTGLIGMLVLYFF